ncbi:hypothetical protein E2C01_064231 [Portunus trituberculatus]|uniref:Uncharacterized protein n=1 Tax=Portunus trituberculatus TaxID=210409 RepID=A0A5B7HL66_PORTR|nr:hypothetical protein [Portunus trituberculatus]
MSYLDAELPPLGRVGAEGSGRRGDKRREDEKKDKGQKWTAGKGERREQEDGGKGNKANSDLQRD